MSSSTAPARGLLFVVSAPSGTGKTTVVERLVKLISGLRQSRSYTSRPPRPGEVDGVDYNFVSRDVFEAMVRRGEFLEWANLFGNLYGTGQQETDARLAAGTDVVLVIDIQGARQVRERVSGTVGVFVLPPSFAALEHRLRGRSHDPEPEIRQRLETARREVSAVTEYDYVVVNDDLDRCVNELATIVNAERARLARMRAVVEPIVRTFDIAKARE
jgi:guanylate kinase